MVKCAFFVFITLILSACDLQNNEDYHDLNLRLTPSDYVDQLTEAPRSKTHHSARPPLQEENHEPIPEQFYTCVSLTTTDAVSLKDLFLSLAQQAQINLLLAPDIKGTAVIHAQKRPLFDLIQEICESHGLRFRIRRNLIRIEVDRPYLQTYHLDFLILSRSNVNRFSIATDVFTGPENSKGDQENSSNTLLTGETKTDFWQELTENLTMLLSIGHSNKDDDSSSPRFSIHKQAGIISVYANHHQHQQIKACLESLRQNIEKQVLIEAKIVEVHLKDECKSGINWDVVKGNFILHSPLGTLVTPGPLSKEHTPQRNVFTIGGGVKDLSALISLLNHFGTVRTLSNPRMTVINNQPAVLKVATNKVYFKLNYTCDYNYFDKREQVYVSSDAKTVPIGLVMVVHPSISHNDGKVTMTLRPTISRIIQEVPDPAVGIASHQKQSSCVPEVQVRELDSVLTMKSGEVIVVGGLMEDRGDHDTVQVTGLSSIPLLGPLFKSQSHDHQVTELVIFLRATVIDNTDTPSKIDTTSVTPADERNYCVFTKDPRPFSF